MVIEVVPLALFYYFRKPFMDVDQQWTVLGGICLAVMNVIIALSIVRKLDGATEPVKILGLLTSPVP